MSSADLSISKHSALIVGGDQINGIKEVLVNYGIDHINHWPGRKVGYGNKVIPYNTKFIVLITNWISHSITHKVKKNAMKRGIKVIYTPNGSAALRNRLQSIESNTASEADCQNLFIHYH
ncbi:MAG: DUF2325 domain-containing protein [Methylotenera sp.]|nr:DUF2325 domain-containing protein [Methylotenera sp.]